MHVCRIWNSEEETYSIRLNAVKLLGSLCSAKSSKSKSTGGKGKKRGKGKLVGREKDVSAGYSVVVPYLQQFEVPAAGCEWQQVRQYCGVLYAYSACSAYIEQQSDSYRSVLLTSRILPAFASANQQLMAHAAWVIGQFSEAIPKKTVNHIYEGLVCILRESSVEYPLHAAAIGALVELVEAEVHPPEWRLLLEALLQQLDVEYKVKGQAMLLEVCAQAQPDAIAPFTEPALRALVPMAVLRMEQAFDEDANNTLDATTDSLCAAITATLEAVEDQPCLTAEAKTSIKEQLCGLLERLWLSNGGTCPSCRREATIIMKWIFENSSSDEIRIAPLANALGCMLQQWLAWTEEDHDEVYLAIDAFTSWLKGIANPAQVGPCLNGLVHFLKMAVEDAPGTLKQISGWRRLCFGGTSP
eukprot:scaffold396_cov339-Prasinococcus_capsulatus_cf.AAC.14